MKQYRFTREVRDLAITIVVAVAGALAARALSNLKAEPAAILAVVLVVSIVLAVAPCCSRPSGRAIAGAFDLQRGRFASSFLFR